MLTGTERLSVGFTAAGGWHDAVHPQIFDHLSVMVVGVRHAEFRQVQARGFSFAHGLQHVFRSQGGGRFMTQRERVLQEFQDVGFGLDVRRAIAVLDGCGHASPVRGDQMK